MVQFCTCAYIKDEEGQDEVTELVSTTVTKSFLGGENAKGANNDDDEVPELGPGEGFMLKDLNTGKMVHIVNDIDSFFDEINFTTFEEIRGKAENAAKNLHGMLIGHYVLHVCMCVCMYVCMYVCIYACMYVCVCVCVCRVRKWESESVRIL